MSISNTIENKAKLFTQYWAQDVLILPMNRDNKTQKLGAALMTKYCVKTRSLLLTPLHLITDEDARKLPNRQYDGFTTMYENKEEFLTSLEIMHFLTQEETDLLRAMGYAVNFQDLSVSEQVEHGWVVLKTKI